MLETTVDSQDEGRYDDVLHDLDADTAQIMKRLLVRLAHAQDEAAAREAAKTPYWKPCPHHVIGLRAAATALRTTAEALPASGLTSVC